MAIKQYPRVLTIAGSDSGGGAGIQADIKTISAHQCYAMSAITAVTAQNSLTVADVHPIPVDIISKQIHVVLEDIGAKTIKTGMLHSVEVIDTVVKSLTPFLERIQIVTDPVMISKSGHKLLQDSAIEALKKKLIPISTVITPNIPEAEVLTGIQIKTEADQRMACKKLVDLGADNVLLKGGHLSGDEAGNLFYDSDEESFYHFPVSRIDTKNTHGTGCTLSAAIASNLALGHSSLQASRLATQYIAKAIDAGKDYITGRGYGPVKHFYNLWNEES